MSEKQASAKVCSVVRSASPVRMVKPGLVEPKFPVVKRIARRSIPDAATSQAARCVARAEIRRGYHYLRNALYDGRLALSGLKGMSREPKRTKRLTSENAGSPKGRESYGDGAPIVVSNDEGAGPEEVREHHTDKVVQGRYRRKLDGERSA